MAGPLDIQRLPRGLVDILGMKATGNTPPQLSQAVNGSLELQDYYLFDRLEILQTTTAIALPGAGNIGFLNTTVPAGQMWCVYDLSFLIPAIAAASSVRTAGVIFHGIGSQNETAFTDQITMAAGEAGIIGRHFDRPFLMTPGSNVGLRTTVYTGAPSTTPILTMRFARIGI